jgi:hypothetical protein
VKLPWRTIERRRAASREIGEAIQIDGLGENAIETMRELFGPLHVSGNGKDRDRPRTGPFPQTQARLNTIQARHPEIEEYHVGLELLSPADGFEAIRSSTNLEPQQRQECVNEQPGVGIVVRDQDSHWRSALEHHWNR